MLEPKKFYRNFDNLLKEIRHQKTGKNYLSVILEVVQGSFGDEIKLGHVRLYEEVNDSFVLAQDFGEQDSSHFTENLHTERECVQQVLIHGSYIYDEDPHVFLVEPTADYHAVPAAILIRGHEQRWIAVFELQSGWEREEVVFSLNAIRTAINQRLFSEAINSELHQAAEIQRSLLPQIMPEIPGYQLAALSRATEIVGGDLYDFYQLDEDVFGVCIGDASGHGLPAALLVRDVVTGLRMGLEKQMKMVHTLKKLNHVIYRSTFSSRFVSLFYGEFERDGHLIFVNAGHPAPIIVKGQQVSELKATGLILGAVPEIALHRSYAHLEPDSVLVLFSDGLFERENPKEDLYSIKRLKQCVVKHQALDAQGILEAVFSDVDKFGHGAKWEDDSTLVIVKRLPE